MVRVGSIYTSASTNYFSLISMYYVTISVIAGRRAGESGVDDFDTADRTAPTRSTFCHDRTAAKRRTWRVAARLTPVADTRCHIAAHLCGAGMSVAYNLQQNGPFGRGKEEAGGVRRSEYKSGHRAMADALRPDKNQNNCSSTASKRPNNPAHAGFFLSDRDGGTAGGDHAAQFRNAGAAVGAGLEPRCRWRVRPDTPRGWRPRWRCGRH